MPDGGSADLRRTSGHRVFAAYHRDARRRVLLVVGMGAAAALALALLISAAVNLHGTADEAPAVAGIAVAPSPSASLRSVPVPRPAPSTTARAASAAAGPQADPAWLTRVATATGIPRRALQGYASATLRLAADDPGCHIPWTTLAAIGAIESNHGTLDGTPIDAAGDPVGLIVGPTLDGRRYPAVPDTDGGRYDRLTTWDRAVGPMQLLPATWAVFGEDASGDGVADPNQIDDAALAAGRLLCSGGGDLSTPDGWAAAVAAYNPALTYLDEVRAKAVAYRTVAQ